MKDWNLPSPDRMGYNPQGHEEHHIGIHDSVAGDLIKDIDTLRKMGCMPAKRTHCFNAVGVKMCEYYMAIANRMDLDFDVRAYGDIDPKKKKEYDKAIGEEARALRLLNKARIKCSENKEFAPCPSK
jgi:hypothetical protein